MVAIGILERSDGVGGAVGVRFARWSSGLGEGMFVWKGGAEASKPEKVGRGGEGENYGSSVVVHLSATTEAKSGQCKGVCVTC